MGKVFDGLRRSLCYTGFIINCMLRKLESQLKRDDEIVGQVR